MTRISSMRKFSFLSESVQITMEVLNNYDGYSWQIDHDYFDYDLIPTAKSL